MPNWKCQLYRRCLSARMSRLAFFSMQATIHPGRRSVVLIKPWLATGTRPTILNPTNSSTIARYGGLSANDAAFLDSLLQTKAKKVVAAQPFRRAYPA